MTSDVPMIVLYAVSVAAAVWVTLDAWQRRLRFFWLWGLLTAAAAAITLAVYLVFRPSQLRVCSTCGRRIVFPGPCSECRGTTTTTAPIADAEETVADVGQLIGILLCGATVAFLVAEAMRKLTSGSTPTANLFPWPVTLVLVAVQSLLFLILSWVVLRRRGVSPREIGWTNHRAGRAVLIGLGAAIILYGINLGLEAFSLFVALRVASPEAVHQLDVREHLLLVRDLPKLPLRWTHLLVFLAIAGLAPVAEEVLFRGMAYTALRRRLGVSVAILVTGMAFAVVHPYVLHFLPILAMGVALAYLREETGSLMAPIVAHVANNTVAVVCYYWFPRFFT